MRRMASYATLCLDRLVLKYERPLFVNMACETDVVSPCRRAQLLADEPTMRVVTIRTLNCSLFHSMVERHVELRFDFLVTAVTQSGLSLSQQKLILDSVMSRVATQTAQIALAMGRTREVYVISARRVAFQAALVDFFRRRGFEAENLLGIAGVVDVAGSSAVTSFASLFGRSTTLIEQSFPVR